MADIHKILAQNLKENRRRLSLTQPQLAERADISIHYLAMIETARKFPSVEVLDKLSKVFGIDSHELFSVPVSPEKALEQLQRDILKNIDMAIDCSVHRAVEKLCGGCPAIKSTCST